MSAHQISDAEKMASEWKPTWRYPPKKRKHKSAIRTEFRPLMVRDGEAIVQWQLVSLPPAPISANLLFSIGTLKKTALVLGLSFFDAVNDLAECLGAERSQLHWLLLVA